MKRIISFIVALAIMATMCVGLTLNVAATTVESVSHACTQTHHDAVSFSKTEAGSVVMQSVTVADSWVGIVFPGWGNDDGTATVEVFAFDTDLATSAAGTALLTETGVVINQVTHNEHRFSTPLPSGDYVIKFSNFAGTCYLGYGDKVNSSTLTSFENVGGPGTPSGHGLVISYITSKDLSSVPQVNVNVANASDMTSSNLNVKYTLTADINTSSTVSFAGSLIEIDLAGHTWSCSDTAFDISTAFVTITDSVGGGKVYASNDAIVTSGNGSLTLDGIAVEADQTGCDAVFIKDGTVTIKNCVLDARQASVHNDNRDGATVLVDGCTLDGDSVALKGRNNAVITVTGNTIFNNKTVDMQRGFDADRSVVDTFKAGANATIEFDSIVVGNGVTTTVKNYTYTAPVVKVPAFTTYTISLSTGISIEYLVENATEDTKVQVNGVDLESDSYIYNEVEYTRFTFSDFGPQQMGDVFEATLIVDGEEKGKLEASVKAYCDAIIASEDASSKLSLLAKDILAYGAAAQNYKNYNKDALVNADVEASGNKYNTPEDKSIVLYTMSNPSVTWKYATVEFANTIKLVLAFEGEADMVKAVISDVEYEFKTIETDDNGYSYVIVDSFTPDQFNKEIDATAYLDGTAVSKTIRYSVGSYANKKGNADNALADLVQAMTIYGESVAAYLVG